MSDSSAGFLPLESVLELCSPVNRKSNGHGVYIEGGIWENKENTVMLTIYYLRSDVGSHVNA